MKQPIIEFKNQEELNACLKEWQDRLFLQDWIIKAVIVDKCDQINGNICAATNTHNHDQKESLIEIKKLADFEKQHYAKCSQEQSLIHELLHNKFVPFRYNETDADGCALNLYNHQLLEQLAKSLFMAKYDLTFDWFKN